MAKTNNRFVLRCSTTGYEGDFKTRKAAEGRRDSLGADGSCQHPHEVVEQVWSDGRWVDVPAPETRRQPVVFYNEETGQTASSYIAVEQG